MKSTNIKWHSANVSSQERENILGMKGAVVWLTGLSGSGKSTIARRLEQLLVENGVLAYVLDGDNLRHGLNSDLGFSPDERSENIRRVGEVAALFADAGVVVIAAFISPYQSDRDTVRGKVANGRFLEVYVETTLETCETRDPKGLYQKARDGQISNFTGISAPYEVPNKPELRLQTEGKSIDQCAQEVAMLMRSISVIK
jgi:adenylylsulfate kinase